MAPDQGLVVTAGILLPGVPILRWVEELNPGWGLVQSFTSGMTAGQAWLYLCSGG